MAGAKVLYRDDIDVSDIFVVAGRLVIYLEPRISCESKCVCVCGVGVHVCVLDRKGEESSGALALLFAVPLKVLLTSIYYRSHGVQTNIKTCGKGDRGPVKRASASGSMRQN